jgi:glyoxalase family protein
MELNGIHHITSVTANIVENVNFYTRVLGLRLVKKSINQDDVTAYHLFYADKLGSPGTDMTFFDWPYIGRNIPGTDNIIGTAFRVGSRAALDFWEKRFSELGVQQDGISIFKNLELLPFRDHEGQQLYLVNDQGADFEGEIWHQPDIPDEYVLKGFWAVVLSVSDKTQISTIFRQLLGFTEVATETWIDNKSLATIYSTKQTNLPGTQVWLIEEKDKKRGRLGAGGTHHVAFRVDNLDIQKEWREHLSQQGLSVSPLIDRFWFSSIYFRVSPGILFEIATDGPGFAIDEDPEKLGESLVLPPFLEDRREEIESGLIPLLV